MRPSRCFIVRLFGGIAAALILITPLHAASVDPRLSQIEKSTQQIRHLTQLHPVNAVFPPNDARFDATIRNVLHRDNPDSEIALAQRELVLLGLLSKNQSFHDIVFNGFTSKILGLYDYKTKSLYVRRNGDVFGPERNNIAHEFTHALQDQHFGLAKIQPDQTKLSYRNSDAVGAVHALIEGDARTTETLFINRTYSVKDIRALLKIWSQPVPGPPLPKAIQREFYFPYTTGVSFVTNLYHRGGMGAVNKAYARLPRSTYEIMHPAAYQAGWKPVSVPLHTLQGYESWTRADDDVFGAFGYNMLLSQWLPKAKADAITDQYRGDRYLLIDNNGQSGMVFRSVWASGKAARAAEAGLLKTLRVRFPHAEPAGTTVTTLTQPGGAEALTVSGSKLTLVYATSADLAAKMAVAQTT